MEALDYEIFIRSAFGYANKRNIERFDDPAGLADTDIYSDKNIENIKAATSYSIGIFLNGVNSGDTSYIKKIINAHSIKNISTIIDEFKNNFISKHYKITESGYLEKI